MIGLDLQAFAACADDWLGCVAAALRGSAVLFAAALIVWLPLRRRLPAQFVYALFLLVLVRLALPFDVVLPAWLAVCSPQYLVENAWTAWSAAPAAGSAEVAGVASAPGAFDTGEAPATVAWKTMLFAAWAAVAGLLLIRFAWRQWRTHGVIGRARELAPGELSPSPDDLRKAAGLRRRVRFLATSEVEVPAAGGLLRACVLLPEGLMEGLTVEQRRFVLLHELAHVRRGDLWVALFQRLVGIAFFFHPLVWWANRIIDEQREFACDDAALAACGGRKACGQGFLSVVEWSQGRASAPAGALGMFHSNDVIRRRLMRILDGNRKIGGRRSTLCTLAALALGVIAVPAVKAQDARSEREIEMEILQAKLDRLEAESRVLRLEMEKLRRNGGGDSGRESVRWLTARPEGRPTLPERVHDRWLEVEAGDDGLPSRVRSRRPTAAPETRVEVGEGRVLLDVPSRRAAPAPEPAGDGGARRTVIRTEDGEILRGVILDREGNTVRGIMRGEARSEPQPDAKGARRVYLLDRNAPQLRGAESYRGTVEVEPDGEPRPEPRQGRRRRVLPGLVDALLPVRDARIETSTKVIGSKPAPEAEPRRARGRREAPRVRGVDLPPVRDGQAMPRSKGVDAVPAPEAEPGRRSRVRLVSPVRGAEVPPAEAAPGSEQAGSQPVPAPSLVPGSYRVRRDATR